MKSELQFLVDKISAISRHRSDLMSSDVQLELMSVLQVISEFQTGSLSNMLLYLQPREVKVLNELKSPSCQQCCYVMENSSEFLIKFQQLPPHCMKDAS
jgi:hypothetical protein